MIIGQMYSIKSSGTISIPTETKNMAPKRSLIGFTIRSILTACTVPASIDPAINAPSADENPMRLAITTIPMQKPTATTSAISSFNSPDIFFNMVGTK